MRYFISAFLFLVLAFAHHSYGFSEKSDVSFLSGVVSVTETDESYLKKSRVGTSYFLEEVGAPDGSSPEDLLAGDGFLGVTLDTQWKIRERGVTLTRSQQKFKGLEVFGGEITTRADKKSRQSAGFMFKGIALDTKPDISSKQAVKKIIAAFGKGSEVEGSLGILPTGRGPTLTYRFTVFRNIKEYYTVYMDANSGKIIRAFNRVDYFNAGGMFKKGGRSFIPPKGFTRAAAKGASQIRPLTGSGITLNKKRVTMPVAEIEPGVYVLYDARNNVVTLDAMGQFRLDPMGTLTPKNPDDDAQLIGSRDKKTWNNPAAVSAHYHSSVIYRFLTEKLKRKSLDDKGIPIRAIVNAIMIQNNQTVVDNAFYMGRYNIMVYLTGSWNGRDGIFKNLAGALDVAAHEFAHGITAHTSDLEYLNESGALNESFSDMMGTAVEYYDDPKNFNWELGEDVIPANSKYFKGAMRFMDDPKKGRQPDTYRGKGWYSGSEDQGGVHTNSGVGNKAFYLIAAGGTHNGVTVPGIGMDKATMIAYRANKVYMGKRSQYYDCAKGFILAAKDLYGDKTAYKVYLAWKAVKLEVKGLVKADSLKDELPGPNIREKVPEVKRDKKKPKLKKKRVPKPRRRRPPAEPSVDDDGFLGGM